MSQEKQLRQESEDKQLIKSTWKERDAVRQANNLLKLSFVPIYFTQQLDDYDAELTEDLQWMIRGLKAVRSGSAPSLMFESEE